jgi:hypothetical protein
MKSHEEIARVEAEIELAKNAPRNGLSTR